MSTNNTLEFPRHDYFYHGLFTDCSVCKHPAQCARLCDVEGQEKADVCRVCIAEGETLELTLEMWCTECETSIPDDLRARPTS
jgi:hypothetical protein